MRDDNVTQCIRYDELAILYGNNFGEKYKKIHHKKLVRSRLSTVGHFILAVQSICSDITDLKSLFMPKYSDLALKAIHKVGRLQMKNMRHHQPHQILVP